MEVRLAQQTTLCGKQIDASACGQTSKSSPSGWRDGESLNINKNVYWKLNIVCCEPEEGLDPKQRNELAALEGPGPDSFYGIQEVTDAMRKINQSEPLFLQIHSVSGHLLSTHYMSHALLIASSQQTTVVFVKDLFSTSFGLSHYLSFFAPGPFLCGSLLLSHSCLVTDNPSLPEPLG